MTFKTMGGATLFIGTSGTPYATETVFVKVGEVTDFGEFGREYVLIEHEPVDVRGTQKVKGGFNEGSFNFVMAEDLADAGQDLMRIAVDEDALRAMKIELDDDALGASGSTPTTYKFDALIMSFVSQFGTRDTVVGASVQMELLPNGVEKTESVIL